MNSGGFFKVTPQCLFDASMSYVAYRRSEEVDWRDNRCSGWFTCNGHIGKLLRIPERQLPGKKCNREGALIAETL